MITLLLAGLSVLTIIFVLIAVVAPPGPPPHCGPLQCQGPPVRHPGATQNASAGAPVTNGVRYTNNQGFSLRYQQTSGDPSSAATSTGITLNYAYGGHGDTTQVQVFGEPAEGTSDQGIVQAIVSQVAPGAQPVYQVPGAMVGYEPGYGEAFDVQSASSDGSTTTTRIIVIGAVHNNFGIAVIAVGKLLAPVTPSSSFWNGHPSPANVAAAYFADPVINSIIFPNPSGP
jgi:hypothetical protein